MTRFTIAVSWVFGAMMLALSIFVAIETISRKLFNFSFQGADELGGYALAVGSSLAFTVALLERGHIRIDLLFGYLPDCIQAVLNWLSVVLLAGMGVFLAWYCLPVIIDTLAYRSTAATPWATPLIYPQAVWYVSLLVFTIAGLWLAGRASRLLCAGKTDEINRNFHPKGALEELADEVVDLEHR